MRAPPTAPSTEWGDWGRVLTSEGSSVDEGLPTAPSTQWEDWGRVLTSEGSSVDEGPPIAPSTEWGDWGRDAPRPDSTSSSLSSIDWK